MAGFRTQQDKLHEYNELVSTFTRVWVGLLGVVVALWCYQRFVLYRRLKRHWDADLDTANAQWDRVRLPFGPLGIPWTNRTPRLLTLVLASAARVASPG